MPSPSLGVSGFEKKKGDGLNVVWDGKQNVVCLMSSNINSCSANLSNNVKNAVQI